MSSSSDPYAKLREERRNAKRSRPAQIETPGPGQESVWDYPRPPRVERVAERIRIEFGGVLLADSQRAYRVIETSSPPTYYLPPEDVRMEHLEPRDHSTFCEWKGIAKYWSVRVGNSLAEDAAWSYPEPDEGYEVIRDYLAFYPQKMDACYVGDQRAKPQPGQYYGGWVTPNIVGPFKGEPGSENW
jgi:uncharacterized protein (DUF427 family)